MHFTLFVKYTSSLDKQWQWYIDFIVVSIKMDNIYEDTKHVQIRISGVLLMYCEIYSVN